MSNGLVIRLMLLIQLQLRLTSNNNYTYFKKEEFDSINLKMRGDE